MLAGAAFRLCADMPTDWQRVAAYVVAQDSQGRVLLTQFEKQGHPQSGAWTLPGGGMEWGEQAIDTALRELEEETGLNGEIGALLGTPAQWFDESASDSGSRGLALRIVFEARNCLGELQKSFHHDNTTVAAAWFTVNEIKQLKRVSVVDFGLSLKLGENAKT